MGAQSRRVATVALRFCLLGGHREAHHHEVATAGQAEIDMEFAPLLKMSDQLMWFKYIVKNVGKNQTKTATFMPKPIFEDNGSGMHTHMSTLEGRAASLRR